MSIAHISYIIALWATSTVNSTPSNVFLALVLVIHCPCICNSSTGAGSTGASSTSARSTGAGSTGARNTKARSTSAGSAGASSTSPSSTSCRTLLLAPGLPAAELLALVLPASVLLAPALPVPVLLLQIHLVLETIF